MMAVVTTFRSRRLEAIFGARVHQVEADHVRSLVTNGVHETFDLDFKRDLYGRADSDRRKLAGDVAALANTAGGVIILGVEENNQACAIAAEGVALSDAELTRMRSILASGIAPLPSFEIIAVPESTGASHGFYLIAVSRSASAPHAVLVDSGYRWPRRNGASTRYLSEPEVAMAYRDRFLGRDQQVTRLEEISTAARRNLARSRPWLVVSLVPDVVGYFEVNGEAFAAFEQEWRTMPTWSFGPRSGSVHFNRCRVGRGCLHADDGLERQSATATRALAELHSDGAGAYALALTRLRGGHDDQELIDSRPIVAGILIALQRLGRHARDRAAASGPATVSVALRGTIDYEAGDLGLTIGFDDDEDGPQSRSPLAVAGGVPPVLGTAEIDDLVLPGRELFAVAARFGDELGQTFGIPELGHLTREGSIIPASWGEADWRAGITQWAALDDDTVEKP
jgi:hypothetical protein